MKLPVLLASLLVASTAYAQAPGEMEETETLAPPGMAPAAAPAYAAPAPVRRWSIGLGIGSLELAPHVAPDAKTEFDIGQLSLRYRPWRHLEIELALGGGSEAVEENAPAGMDVSQAVLALRYRFNPHNHWNWWLMAGMGSLAVTRHDPTKEERDAASQSTLQFGGGMEYRWQRFAIQFEVRAVGVAPHDEADQMTVKVETTMPLPPGSEPYSSDDGWAGGQFAFSGNYYF